MKYIIDKNVLANSILENRRDDLCITEEVLVEGSYSDAEIKQFKGKGISIIKLGHKHLETLKDVMANHGANFRFIDLYSSKGTADAAIIAFVLSEVRNPDSLFPEEYTIVTKDDELAIVAKSYGLSVSSEIPDRYL